MCLTVRCCVVAVGWIHPLQIVRLAPRAASASSTGPRSSPLAPLPLHTRRATHPLSPRPASALPCCSVVPPDAFSAATAAVVTSGPRRREPKCGATRRHAHKAAECSGRHGAARRGWAGDGVAWSCGACGAKLGPGQALGGRRRRLDSVPLVPCWSQSEESVVCECRARRESSGGRCS